jgi:hypothetical protein
MTFENFFFLPGSAKAAGGQRMMGHGRSLSSKLHLDILSQYPSKANLMLSTGVTLATFFEVSTRNIRMYNFIYIYESKSDALHGRIIIHFAKKKNLQSTKKPTTSSRWRVANSWRVFLSRAKN